jgi:hypothetical protein
MVALERSDALAVLAEAVLAEMVIQAIAVIPLRMAGSEYKTFIVLAQTNTTLAGVAEVVTLDQAHLRGVLEAVVNLMHLQMERMGLPILVVVAVVLRREILIRVAQVAQASLLCVPLMIWGRYKT